MKISDLINRIRLTPIQNKMGYIFPDIESKNECLTMMNYLMSELGDHSVSDMEKYQNMFDRKAETSRQLAKKSSIRYGIELTEKNIKELEMKELDYENYTAMKAISLASLYE